MLQRRPSQRQSSSRKGVSISERPVFVQRVKCRQRLAKSFAYPTYGHFHKATVLTVLILLSKHWPVVFFGHGADSFVAVVIIFIQPFRPYAS